MTKELTIEGIVRKLIGPVQPTGEHNTDQQRLENIKELTRLVDDLLDDLEDAAYCAVSHEASVKAIGQHARLFLLAVLQRKIL